MAGGVFPISRSTSPEANRDIRPQETRSGVLGDRVSRCGVAGLSAVVLRRDLFCSQPRCATGAAQEQIARTYAPVSASVPTRGKVFRKHSIRCISGRCDVDVTDARNSRLGLPALVSLLTVTALAVQPRIFAVS